MASRDELAERIRAELARRDDITEKKMFGGIGFMLAGNMACGVHGDDLIVRLDADEAEKALTEAYVRRFDLTGRAMKGWVFVGPEATASDQDLAGWVDAGADFAASLSSK